MAALSSLVTLAGLAGCSSSGYNTGKQASQTSDAECRQSSGSYMVTSSIGQVMTTSHGMTVYTFDNDQPRQSNAMTRAQSIGRL
jgi:predicted lipoprotein with Yx(FWY)xxD motif